MKYALIFPGQGSQTVGMGKDLYETSAAGRAAFAEADEALGFPLSDIIFNGPEDKLVLTEYTQPAILTMSVAVLRAMAEQGISLSPAFVAGHSLGEYTALVANGVLSLADGVRLVNKRGHFMQQAVPQGVGAMAAILGLDADTVKGVCAAAAGDDVCEAANFNTPVQTVVSGHTAAVERAVALASQKGARKAVMLKVSAPFHCLLLRSVADQLAVEMEKCAWNAPVCPLMANVSAQAASDVETIRKGLYDQTYSPVRWVESVQTMIAAGVTHFIEIGAGKVLSGMVKKIDRKAAVMNVEHPADFKKVALFIAPEVRE